MSAVAYLDASALVKLAVRETETEALERYALNCLGMLSSRLGAVEARRAAQRASPAASEQLDYEIEALYLYEITESILALAGRLEPHDLRTGDAIHLATALTMAEAKLEFVTYDLRLARAATANGLRVVQPGR